MACPTSWPLPSASLSLTQTSAQELPCSGPHAASTAWARTAGVLAASHSLGAGRDGGGGSGDGLEGGGGLGLVGDGEGALVAEAGGEVLLREALLGALACRLVRGDLGLAEDPVGGGEAAVGDRGLGGLHPRLEGARVGLRAARGRR